MVKELKVSELRKMLGIKKLKGRINVSKAEMAALKELKQKARQKSLDIGLQDLANGRIRRYKSVKGLSKDIWG